MPDSSDSESQAIIEPEENIAMNVTTELQQNVTCIIDSGASKHMIQDKSAFINYIPTPNSFVTVANNEKTPCLGCGTAVFYL